MAVQFPEWCQFQHVSVNGHVLNILSLVEEKFEMAYGLVADSVPSHYSPRVADVLEKFGKQKAATYLRDRLPQTARIRSGDLGEIIATDYIAEHTQYEAPIKRLRWKDHREMSMRGDDVIAISLPAKGTPIMFLKGEAKSRATLSARVVEEAREALDKDNGLPSPHALAFISDRLHSNGQDEMADLIDRSQLEYGIAAEQVEHFFFVLCGNGPAAFLKAELEDYDGSISQIAVGLRVTKHREFVAAVYEAVQSNYGS